MKAWVGPAAHAIDCKKLPGQVRVSDGLHVVGVKVAVVNAARPVPVSATDAGVTVAPVYVTAMVRLNEVAVVGAKTTLIVQFAPTPSVAPHVPGFAIGRENGCGVPPPNVNAPPAKAPDPVFVTVRVKAALVAPTVVFGNASDVGLTLAVKVAAAPVPVNCTGEPVMGALPVRVSDPLSGPEAVGVKTTPMVQFAPAARVVVQVPAAAPAARAYMVVEKPRVRPVRLAPPELVRVRFLADVVLPTPTLPKASVVGATVTIG